MNLLKKFNNYRKENEWLSFREIFTNLIQLIRVFLQC